ncbi:hypothetical protein D1872_247670 [compost metagenome]
MKRIWLLPHHANLLAKLDYIGSRLIQVVTVHPDMSLCTGTGNLVVHSVQRPEERGFTATRRSNKSRYACFRKRQANLLDRLEMSIIYA